MADMHEVSTILSTTMEPGQSGSLPATVQEAMAVAAAAQQQVENILEGSDHELADALRGDMNAIVQGLGEVAARVESARDTSMALVEAWGGSSALPAEPVTIAPARMPDAQESGPATGKRTPEPFEPVHDLMHPDVQRRMDTPVAKLFTPRAVGDHASQRILYTMRSYGLHSVRDVLLAGKRVAQGTLAARYFELVESTIQSICPEVPFNTYLTPESAAKVTDSIDNVPIQTVLPGYKHSTRRRVTVGDTLHADGTYNNQGLARFNSRDGHTQRSLESFAAAFNQARRAMSQDAGE